MALLPTGSLRLSRIGLICLCGIFAFWNAGKGATPDFQEAWRFGILLQQDYFKRHGAALIDRVDENAMLRRVFTALLTDNPRELAALQKIWRESFFPNLQREFTQTEKLSALVVARVIYVDDARGLECLLIDPEGGAFQLITLRLTKTDDGEIKIEDFRLAARYLEFCRNMRFLMLLLGVPLPGTTDPEEIDMQILGKESRSMIMSSMRSVASGDLNQAFKDWNAVSPRLKASRLWRDVRANLAFKGSDIAMADLQQECREGHNANPFSRFAIMSSAHDTKAALAALDEVLKDYHDLAFLRAIKAGLLVDLGRAPQGLQLALETIAVAPRTGSAYFAAIRAAASMGDRSAAMQLVRSWGQLISNAEARRLIELQPDLASFRETTEYQTWKKEVQETAPATSSPAESPVPKN